MGRATLPQAINLLEELNITPSLTNKREILSFLQDNGVTSNDADKAYKLGLRSNKRFSLSISEALDALLHIPHITPAEAGDVLIQKGINPEAVHSALQSLDMDDLDDIDGHDNSMISPYLQDGDQAYSENEDKISDLDPTVMSNLVQFIQTQPDADDMQIEKFLEAHGLESNQCRAVLRMIHLVEEGQVGGQESSQAPEQEARLAGAGFEPNSYTDDTDVSPDLLARILISDHQANEEQAINIMVDSGVPEEDAVQAVRQLRENVVNEKYDRPQGDLGGVMGQGATEEGSTEMPGADAGGDPAMNNVGGGQTTTGEDLGAGTVGQAENPSTVGMGEIEQEKNPAEGNSVHDQQVRPGEEDWNGMVDSYLADNPNMSNEEIGAILQHNGAPQSTVREIMRQYESQNTGEAIQPGASVSYKGKNYKIAGTTSTLYGDTIVLANDETSLVVMADDDNIGPATPEPKTASVEVTFNTLSEKVSAFFAEEYRYESSDLQRMASNAHTLVTELNEFSPTKLSESVGIRDKISLLKTAANVFESTATQQSQEVQEYMDSQPQYHVGRVAEGNEFGPGGGDAIAIVAAEMEQEHQDLIETWPKTAATFASQLVEDNSEYIGSVGDMRRVASRTIDAKFAHLDKETQDEVRANFLGFVEKARRLSLRDLPKKEASSHKFPHDFDEGVLL